jgi:DNA topoisomerase-6 subunit B
MASEKFTVVRKILPRLAEKTSALVNEPVPDLTPVITKIMNVVAVESSQDEEKGTSALALTNYTERPRDLKLFMELPEESLGEGFGVDPSAEQVDPSAGRVTWKTFHLSPNERYDVKFRWPKGIEVDLADSGIYVAGVDEAHLLGADPLPGDWDVRLPKELVEEAKATEKEAEGEEVDYDAAERKEGVKDED